MTHANQPTLSVSFATAPRVTSADIKANILTEQYYVPPGTLHTICILTLKNGFTVSGEAACVSPENFDLEKGRRIARENAVEKMWPLMGYALKEKLRGNN